MKGLASFVTGTAAGAALQYVFDPDLGRRRRARLRDALVSTSSQLSDAGSVTARDVGNRARGQVARLRSLTRSGPATDEQVAERVRAEIGFAVDHPSAIDVGVRDGRVTLSGPVLAHEVRHLLDTVRAVRGVRDVDNRLEVHREPGNVPGLQGAPSRRRRGGRGTFMQEVWSPSARLAAGAGGAALSVLGLRAGGVGGTALGLGGLAMLLRGATNLNLARLTGIGAGRRAIVVQKTLTVQAPVEQVFDAWSRYENFPQFMSWVREVRRSADGRSHWTIAGPAGAPVEWDTEQTAFQRNELIAWRTVPGSIVQHAGVVRFEPGPSGGTRVTVRMSYTPPAGAIGHGVAALLGFDPRRIMDQDLVRLKSLLEEGKTTAHGTTVTRDRVMR